MKTDSIFYNLFRTFPSILFELINRPPEESASYEFTSREVKQLAFRLDGLFLPKTSEPDKPFYLVEVQFQPDIALRAYVRTLPYSLFPIPHSLFT